MAVEALPLPVALLMIGLRAKVQTANPGFVFLIFEPEVLLLLVELFFTDLPLAFKRGNMPMSDSCKDLEPVGGKRN